MKHLFFVFGLSTALFLGYSAEAQAGGTVGNGVVHYTGESHTGKVAEGGSHTGKFIFTSAFGGHMGNGLADGSGSMDLLNESTDKTISLRGGHGDPTGI